MKARVVIPTAAGELVSYDIVQHGAELKIVFATSEESFERWLFYLLREIGAHVVTDDVAGLRRGLGLSEAEMGVVDEENVPEPLLNRHPATA